MSRNIGAALLVAVLAAAPAFAQRPKVSVSQDGSRVKIEMPLVTPTPSGVYGSTHSVVTYGSTLHALQYTVRGGSASAVAVTLQCSGNGGSTWGALMTITGLTSGYGQVTSSYCSDVRGYFVTAGTTTAVITPTYFGSVPALAGGLGICGINQGVLYDAAGVASCNSGFIYTGSRVGMGDVATPNVGLEIGAAPSFSGGLRLQATGTDPAYYTTLAHNYGSNFDFTISYKINALSEFVAQRINADRIRLQPGGTNVLTLFATGVVIPVMATTGSTQSAVCRNATTGEITYNNGAATCTVSDEEKKTVLEPLSVDASGLIKSLRPSEYRWLSSPDGPTSWGFGAQSLQAADPHLAAGYDARGIARAPNEYALQALTVKALQEIISRLEALEKRK